MGVISRKIFPACESMCVCCPALRSRSRQPVKRYKKYLAEIFPKSPVSFFSPVNFLSWNWLLRLFNCLFYLLIGYSSFLSDTQIFQ